MLLSFALIFIVGLALASIVEKLKMPRLLGMLLAGMILGPALLNWIDGSVLTISPQLREIALIVILTRAGLSLDIKDLKRVGRPAILMCCIPACFEMVGVFLLAPPLLGVSYIEALIIGSVLGAVSPAVIVPKMIKIMDEGYGVKKSIPQMILAGASVDDVFVITLFYVFLGLAQTGEFSAVSLIQIPISIVLGLVVGVGCGFGLSKFFKFVKTNDIIKVILLLSVAFLLYSMELALKDKVPFSSALAVMTTATVLYKMSETTAKSLQKKFNHLWAFAEIILFVLVGATVKFQYLSGVWLPALLLIFCVLGFRAVGVFICMLKTNLSMKERAFCMVAYMPKATVQAAIGGIPLAMGLACGDIVLTVAVLSIIVTAPLGAFAIDMIYKRCLHKDDVPRAEILEDEEQAILVEEI